MKINLRIIPLLLIIFLLSIAFVSASENTTQDTLELETNDSFDVMEIDNVEQSITSDNSIKAKSLTDLEGIFNNSNIGDTIDLDCDYEFDDDSGTRVIELRKSLTINGNGHSLDGKNKVRILNIHADNVFLNNITFKNGYSSKSIGALYCDGSNFTITHCTFINNNANGSTAGDGDGIGIVAGGLYLEGDNNRIIGNTFMNNIVGGSGGGLALDGNNNIIENNYFENNKALRHMNGGAMQLGRGSKTIIRNNTFKDNYAGMGGGAVELQHSHGDIIENNHFIHNGADYGGAISIYNTSYFTLRNNEFTDSYANGELGIGASVRIWLIDFKTTSIVSGNKFKNGVASVTGGALYIYGDNIKITKNTFTDNTAEKQGGGIINALGNDITISNNEIINSTAYTCGGAIYIDGNNAKITSNSIINSKAHTGGGAIYVKGDSVAINNNDISNSNAGTHSGAVYVEGKNAQISSNDFANNKATTFGGAVYVNGENANINKNSFISNHAGKDSKGGAIRTTGKNAKITGNTFNKNTAGAGSTILVWKGDSTKITNNTFVDYNDNSILYYGNNLIIQDNNGIIDKTKLIISAKTYSITSSKPLTVKLVNSKGLAITGKSISVRAYGKTYKGVTNSKGQATVYLKLPKLAKYKCVATFNKDKYNLASTKSVFVKVTKQTTKITIPNKKFKKSAKSKKVTITLKTPAGKAIAKKKVTLKVNGKTYKGVTNSKGKITMKLKLSKKKTYKALVKFAGDKKYKASKKTAKIIVK